MSRIRKWRLMALLLLVVPALIQADDESRYEVKFARNLEYRGGRVNIDHQFGEILLTSAPGSQVQVRATIRASDPEFGGQIRIVTTEGPEGVTVRTVYPSRRIRLEYFSYSVDYRISIPVNAPVTVKNRFGSINVSGLRAPGEIVNAQGSIKARDLKSSQTIENAFGSIELSDSEGDTRVRNGNGSVRIDRVGGKLDVINRFGSVSLTSAAADVSISNTNGSIDARDIGGNASLKNAFGAIAVRGVNGNLEANSTNSRIVAQSIRGNATVATAFGNLEIRDVGGALNATNANASVTVNGVGRDAHVRTSFASVFLSDVKGAVDVQNQNGSVSVDGLAAGGCRPVSVRTSFGSIKLALPANASYAVNARTSFGRVNSAFPITTTMMNEQSVTGTIGSGACKLELMNQNGNINIERE